VNTYLLLVTRTKENHLKIYLTGSKKWEKIKVCVLLEHLSNFQKTNCNQPDPSLDLVSEKRKEKKERVAKNEMQQRRNVEEGMAQAKGIDYRSMRKEELRRRLQDAKKSNASMGKFDKLEDGVKLRAGKRKVC
jgi:hypothetical protein